MSCHAPQPRSRMTEHFASLIEALYRAAAARAGRKHALAPLVLLICPYLRRLARRFETIVARVRSGAPAPLTRPRTAPRRAGVRGPRLPGRYAWLVKLSPECAALGGQLRHLLAQPEMAALLEAAPGAGRILRPLCLAMGIKPGQDVPAALFPPPVARPKPAPTADAALTADAAPNADAPAAPAPGPAAPATLPPSWSRPLLPRLAASTGAWNVIPSVLKPA